MKALILVGGLGTRIRSLFPDTPKALVPVAGKPFLEYQLEQLRAQGFLHFVLCVGYLAEQIQAQFGDGRRLGVRIDYSTEDTLLGTAGAIRNAWRHIDDTFLVCNGDTFLELDFGSLVSAHLRHLKANSQTVGTLAAVRVEQAHASGALELDDEGLIRWFLEKQLAGASWVNGGVYVFEPSILQNIPGGREVSIEKETFPTALKAGLNLYSHAVTGFFADIGTPDGYDRFCQYAKERLG